MSRIKCAALAGISVLSAVVALLGVQMPASAATYAVGGSTSFAPGAVVKLSAGSSMPAIQYMQVQNNGSGPAEMLFAGITDGGVSITSDTSTFTLAPGEIKKIMFGIDVSVGVAPKKYKVQIQARQTNVPRNAKISYAPAVGGVFYVAVSNASATANIAAVNAQDHSPVTGVVRLDYNPTGADHFQVGTVTGSRMSVAVAPGSYRATFMIPNLVTKSVDFQIAAGETKSVDIPVDAINFCVPSRSPSALKRRWCPGRDLNPYDC